MTELSKPRLAMACFEMLDSELKINRTSKGRVLITKQIFAVLDFNHTSLNDSIDKIKDRVIAPAIKRLIDSIEADYNQLKEQCKCDIFICFDHLPFIEMSDKIKNCHVVNNKSANLSLRLTRKMQQHDDVFLDEIEILYNLMD